jgi:GntR family transcriptional regulator
MAVIREDRRALSQQVRDRIRELVQETYRPADKLPSEQEFAARFGVSRATVREALRILEEERVIICRHGVGRFLAPDSIDVLSEDITQLRGLTEMARALGISIQTQVLGLRDEVADEEVRTHLGLEPGARILILERIRHALGEPIIYSIDIFPKQLVVGDVDAEMFTGSLLAIMEGCWNVRLSYAKTIIRAAMLDSEVSERLGASDNLAWLYAEQVNFDPNDRPVLYSRDYHRSDKIQFRVLRRRR